MWKPAALRTAVLIAGVAIALLAGGWPRIKGRFCIDQLGVSTG